MSKWQLKAPHPRFEGTTYQTGTFLVTEGETLVCEMRHAATNSQDAKASKARGRLIAAAPGLLDAIVSSARGAYNPDRCTISRKSLDMARDAIAKAKGGPPA